MSGPQVWKASFPPHAARRTCSEEGNAPPNRQLIAYYEHAHLQREDAVARNARRGTRQPQATPTISNLTDLLAWEAAQDAALTGMTLDLQRTTNLADEGAHDPDPTPYFVLDALFGHYAFDEHSHLLDVGCGTGRVLAYYLRQGFPGTATGVELDAQLAQAAQFWTARHSNLEVLQGSALDLDFSRYTDFYLFNPFDQGVLQRFIEKLELEVTSPCTLVHMSDNGDTWRYVGRPGWTELASGTFQYAQNDRGFKIKVYDHPQHYTVWRYDPA